MKVRMGIRQLLTLYVPRWRRSRPSRFFKRWRLEKIDRLTGGKLLNQEALKILDIGCESGQDYIRFMEGKNVQLYGVDLIDKKIEQDNFTMIVADAECLPFPDKFFNFAVSMGTFEHIQPIEKLCRTVREVDRVAKSYYITVPSISTVFEPHTGSFFWPVRSHNRKQQYEMLNYFSDEAWLQFEGFREARIMRIYYIPFFISNTIIYKR